MGRGNPPRFPCAMGREIFGVCSWTRPARAGKLRLREEKKNWIFAVVEHWAWKSEVFVEGTGFRGKETADRNPSFVGRV